MNPLTAFEYPDIWTAKNSALDQDGKVSNACSDRWSILGDCVKVSSPEKVLGVPVGVKGKIEFWEAYHLRTLSHLEPRCGMCVSLCRSMN